MLKDAVLNPFSPPEEGLAEEFEAGLQQAGEDVRGMGQAILSARDKIAEVTSRDPGDPDKRKLPIPTKSGYN